MVEKKYYSIITIHPGEYLADELQARNISQKNFAHIIQKTPTELNELIKGKRSLTPDRAIRISSALGTSLDMRLSLQESYIISTTRHLASQQNSLIQDIKQAYNFYITKHCVSVYS